MKALFILFLLCFSTKLFAQKRAFIKGAVFDTAAKKPVEGATVSLINGADSSLILFTRTANTGEFQLRGVTAGQYVLLISHVSFHNHTIPISVSDTTNSIDAGYLSLTSKSTALTAVTVYTEAPPVMIKNDTIEFNANSFKVAPNANVEDLLKKMHGLQVDKEGKIKANGQEVKKILVDGKDFFSNDTRIASQNLPAEIVDKVQVFERKSDQSQFSGFDDGKSEQTINLSLKKDRKKGLFGRANGGVGNRDRYQGSYTINHFKGNRQLSSIGMANNTNKQAFTFMDLMNFEEGLSGSIPHEGTNNSVTSASSNNNNTSSIKQTIATGINYNNNWKKLTASGSFFYNSIDDDIKRKVSREYTLPGNSFKRSQTDTANTQNNSHRLNLSLDYKIDSVNSIRWATSFNQQEQQGLSRNKISTISDVGAQDGLVNTDTKGSGYDWSNQLLWRHRFAKKGRTLSTNFSFDKTDKNKTSNLYSLNSFKIGDSSIIDQEQQQNVGSTKKAITISYTEPLSKKMAIEANVQHYTTTNNSNKETFDYNKSSGSYNIKNAVLSNDFANKYTYQQAGIKWRYAEKRTTITTGIAAKATRLYNQFHFQTKDSGFTRNFFNLLPSFQLQYNINKYQNFRTSYSVETNIPSPSQLNPIIDNTDPFNVRIGNPYLKQEVIHQARIHFLSVDPYQHKNLFAMADARLNRNAIVMNETLDSGVITTTLKNANGAYSLNAFVNWGMPLRFMKSNLSLNTTFNKSRNIGYINGNKNNISNHTVAEELMINYTDQKTVDINAGVQLTYNQATYSINRHNNTSYWNQQYTFNTNLYLPKSFTIGSEFSFIRYTGFSDGYNTSVPLWNLGLAKAVLKNKKGEIKVQLFDLLNKNIGVSRNTSQNYIEDIQSNVLKRYCLLSFTYNISRFAGKPVQHSGGMMHGGREVKIIN